MRPVCSVKGCSSFGNKPRGGGLVYCQRHKTQLQRKGRIVPDDEPRARPKRVRSFVRRVGPNWDAAREGLSAEEREAFEALAEDYQETAIVIHNTPFVSPRVLRELVRIGWRKEGEPSQAPELECTGHPDCADNPSCSCHAGCRHPRTVVR